MVCTIFRFSALFAAHFGVFGNWVGKGKRGGARRDLPVGVCTIDRQRGRGGGGEGWLFGGQRMKCNFRLVFVVYEFFLATAAGGICGMCGWQGEEDHLAGEHGGGGEREEWLASLCTLIRGVAHVAHAAIAAFSLLTTQRSICNICNILLHIHKLRLSFFHVSLFFGHKFFN